MTISVYDMVWVRLTKQGEQIMRAEFGDAYTISQTDQDGRMKFQVWELFRYFGRDIQAGIVPPFGAEIDLV
jgi:hypothetical protein